MPKVWRTFHFSAESPKDFEDREKTKTWISTKFILHSARNCRAQSFAEQMIGNNLKRVERVRHVAKRRQEELHPIKTDTRLGTTVYKTECFICNQGCDALVHVKDGVVVRVEGDTSSEVTKGTLCAKGLASKEILYHRERLLYPMKRLGARGEGG